MRSVHFGPKDREPSFSAAREVRSWAVSRCRAEGPFCGAEPRGALDPKRK